jgi:zinc protease
MIVKYRLENGLIILVYPMPTVAKVSLQVWYAVGSKHERFGQKGLAHLLEHMVFKGTQRLSEVDITHITGKFSGYCNAFTSQDYTTYIFDFPSNQWTIGLDLLADCMRNCTFKPDLLNSELGAVVQELKLYRDAYDSTLEEELMALMFAGHPYHYPIIGNKQDLFAATQTTLMEFYKTHYTPHNATLVVVGAVDPEQVRTQAEHYFGAFASELAPTVPTRPWTPDIRSTGVTLYRDVHQPEGLLAFVIPGLSARKNYYIDVIAWIVGRGKASRLYTKLVTELSLAIDVDVYWHDLFEHGVLFIKYYPRHMSDNEAIKRIIFDELTALGAHDPSEHEIMRATKQVAMEHYELFESQEEVASQLGKLYLATGDERSLLTYLDVDQATLANTIRLLITDYLRPVLAHEGLLLPIPEQEQEQLVTLQEQADEADEAALVARPRQSVLEQGEYVTTLTATRPPVFVLPHHKRAVLGNGLTIAYYHTEQTPTITLALDFATNHHYDPADKLGLSNFAFKTISIAQTKAYTAQQLVHELELHGMSITAGAGGLVMTMLSKDFEHGLRLLRQIVTESVLDVATLETVRSQILADLHAYWDDPITCIKQIARQAVYGQHPYAHHPLGTLQTVERITRDDLIAFYQHACTPHRSTLAVVGAIQDYDIPTLMQQELGAWQGSKVSELVYPVINHRKAQRVYYPMQRDQVALGLATSSLARLDNNYDALVLLDYLVTGGPQGSMHSRLFALREQTGLFYTIGGSLCDNAGKQPGMLFIKTLISPDTIDEVEAAIKRVLHDAQQITDYEVVQAQHALIYGMLDAFESHRSMAEVFLFLERYGLEADYFDMRVARLAAITQEQIRAVAAELVRVDRLHTILVGRVDNEYLNKKGYARDEEQN